VPARAKRRTPAGSLFEPTAVAVAAAAAVSYVAAVDPNQPGHYPGCPVLSLTGFFCPGCGTLRALHALAHGDLVAAAGFNIMAVLAVVGLAVIWVQWTRRRWLGRPRTSTAPPARLWALLVVVVAFTVVRNLPPGAVLAP
jgi:hypothetical protein